MLKLTLTLKLDSIISAEVVARLKFYLNKRKNEEGVMIVTNCCKSCECRNRYK